MRMSNFFATHQIRVVQVPLRDVVLVATVLRLLRPAVAHPRLNLIWLRREEDALALRAADGLHDPHPPVLAKVPEHHRALVRKNERRRNEVVLRGVQTVFRRALQRPLHVLRHEIFPRQLHVVGEVVHALVLAETQTLRPRAGVRHVLVYPPHVRVEEVPRVVVHLLPPARAQHFVRDAVPNRCAEPDLATEGGALRQPGRRVALLHRVPGRRDVSSSALDR
mmetsp:Transcript_13911/g.58519  ORF Transcript_13911/g.58519 Transcript_13911/m.58519 type:complete len:222 (+) Transcript_13911:788-1453(+)